MLIKTKTRKLWTPDPVIRGLIEHFDRPEKINRLDKLNKRELDLIKTEQRKCSDGWDGFGYAAKNYFWITNKDKRDVRFSLFESQELILDEIKRLYAKNKAQKLIILKSRQLGCSTLVEAMVAWKTMFFPNTNAVVVSYDLPHSEYLFSIMLHIYDYMPWWLKPDISSRKYQDGLVFENHEEEMRRVSPGLNSRIDVHVGYAAGRAWPRAGAFRSAHFRVCSLRPRRSGEYD